MAIPLPAEVRVRLETDGMVRSKTAGIQVGESACRVSLLGTFGISGVGHGAPLPGGSARLVAFLALQRYPVSRARAAGVLWSESSEDKARGSLRSALWRVRRCVGDLIETGDESLRLSPAVLVDADEFAVSARTIINGGSIDLRGVDADVFCAELLPDWYDDWVIFERERIRQLALHGLEALSARLAEAGHYAPAVEAALMAISLEPLRESAHRALIDVHVAEGNVSEAVSRFELYRQLLASEMGIAPTRQLAERVRQVLDARRVPASTAAR